MIKKGTWVDFFPNALKNSYQPDVDGKCIAIVAADSDGKSATLLVIDATARPISVKNVARKGTATDNGVPEWELQSVSDVDQVMSEMGEKVNEIREIQKEKNVEDTGIVVPPLEAETLSNAANTDTPNPDADGLLPDPKGEKQAADNNSAGA